jgi:hypothetical protein
MFYIGNTKGIILRSISCNLLMFGWIDDLLYMDKTFDEAMARRGYVNTNIRNEVDKK